VSRHSDDHGEEKASPKGASLDFLQCFRTCLNRDFEKTLVIREANAGRIDMMEKLATTITKLMKDRLRMMHLSS